jgi:hypothetical protein
MSGRATISLRQMRSVLGSRGADNPEAEFARAWRDGRLTLKGVLSEHLPGRQGQVINRGIVVIHPETPVR